MAKWGDCKHLYKVLTGKDMKDIGEAKCKAAYKDGKKRFKGREISPRELDRKPFVILDFERDVIPRWEQERYRKDVAQAGGDASYGASAGLASAASSSHPLNTNAIFGSRLCFIPSLA